MKYYVMTLFPEMIEQAMNTSIMGRAMADGLISLQVMNIRDYTLNKHGKVDDYPYGGGAGAPEKIHRLLVIALKHHHILAFLTEGHPERNAPAVVLYRC